MRVEWLLVIACFFLWRIAKWSKECALQLMILNGTAHEQNRIAKDGLERVESRVDDVSEKMSSVQETTDAYYREYIKPMRGY